MRIRTAATFVVGLLRAHLCFARGDYVSARRHFYLAVKAGGQINSNLLPDALMLLAICEDKTGNRDRAIEACEKASAIITSSDRYSADDRAYLETYMRFVMESHSDRRVALDFDLRIVKSSLKRDFPLRIVGITTDPSAAAASERRNRGNRKPQVVTAERRFEAARVQITQRGADRLSRCKASLPR